MIKNVLCIYDLKKIERKYPMSFQRMAGETIHHVLSNENSYDLFFKYTYTLIKRLREIYIHKNINLGYLWKTWL